MQDERNLFNPLDLDVSRSTFHNKPTRSGTCMSGRLIPAWYRPIMPGTGINMKTDSLFKMSTPVYPTMDRLFADMYFFFTPNRLVMSRRYGTPDLNDSVYSWAYFIGAQDNLLNMPLPQNGAELPAVVVTGYQDSNSQWHSYRVGSLADYFNIPGNNQTAQKYSPFPMLSYVAIYNENFREPSTAIPVTWSISSGVFNFYHDSANLLITSTEATLFGITNSNNLDYLWANPFKLSTSLDLNAMLPLPTSVFHGYLGSMLPWPQRNASGVSLPLGDKAPLSIAATGLNLQIKNNSGSLVPSGTALGSLSSLGDANPGASANVASSLNSATSVLFANVPPGVYADLSQATAANVNALRAAIQQQRWYEKLARSGNRYDELEYGTFGVRPKDSGSDRPVYLGGKRIELNMSMVASTNGGSSDSSAAGSGSLGSLGAFSHTNDKDSYMFSAEFDDWGTLMCVFTIRHPITLGSGTDRANLKNIRDEFYFPTFAHLGEQSEWLGEVADVGGWNASNSKQSIGFQQAWEEERTDVDRVSGLLRPGENLAFMTYAETHTSGFSLAQFLNASRQIVHIDNTLAVSSIASGFQFIYQITFDYVMRAPIPVYSIPGLMDHF